MADVVNLDALIPRQDFLAAEKTEEGGDKGKAEVYLTDLRPDDFFRTTLRKPDFQRETAAWTPEMICDFVETFVGDELIPAVICWQSPSRLSFVIDGAHRLSALIAWISDDYGDGDASVKFYANNIPSEQDRIAKVTRALIDKRIGSYKQLLIANQNPGSNSKYETRARGLAHSKLPLLWVKGNRPRKAERAFFTINQSAVAINPTELKIINARDKPNAVAARIIVRNATGHPYWRDFSPEGQAEAIRLGKDIYTALYSPPLDPPIKTEELPIAGHGYGSQTLPLIYEFVNVANGFDVVDPSKKKIVNLAKDKEEDEDRPKVSEADTLGVLRRTAHLVRAMTGTHASSLGLHPAVYFYSANGRHQPTTVLAMGALMKRLDERNLFGKFCGARAAFEDFLVGHKAYVNQLTVKHGSMVKGFLPISNYYWLVLEMLLDSKNEAAIEAALSAHDKYQFLFKERPTLTTKAKPFSADARQLKMLEDVLGAAMRCPLCGARMDKKSMQLDHVVDKAEGGLGVTGNSQHTHPYCNSTYKRTLVATASSASPLSEPPR